MGHFYLLIEREFITLSHKIYKIGRCVGIFSRINGYPKGSILIECHYTNDEHTLEQLVKYAFIKHPLIKRERQIGKEYFSGDLDLLRSVISSLVIKQKSIIILTSDKLRKFQSR